LRDRAAREGVASLHAELAAVDPAAAERIHPNDLRRIERALEVHHATGRPISTLQSQWDADPAARYDCRLVALRRAKEPTSRRINQRVRAMIEAGLLDEVRALLTEPSGIGPQAAQAVGYAELIAHLRGELSLAQAVERIKINTRRLAKSQRTWMRRLAGVKWIDVEEDEPIERIADRVYEAWQQPVEH